MEQRFERVFSLEEADELVPRLEVIMCELQSEANQFAEMLRDVVLRQGGIQAVDLEQVARAHPEVHTAATKMAQLASQIESFGCILKDIDLGLVDFPAEIDGTIVFLCWQFGEPHVMFWHGLDDGFAGRKLLPGAAKFYAN